jgi:uncharacterized damage-inducible protein DinB
MTRTERPEELVAALRADLDQLIEIAGPLPDEAMERQRSEGWTARQVLAHLADFELIAAVRVRTILSLDRPTLATYGQEEFTERFGRLESAGDALERFAVNRRATVRVLEAIGKAEWERPAIHPLRGEETLSRTVQMLVRHDRDHLEQLRRAAED